MKGFGIFIEAGFLSVINYIFFGGHESIINFLLIISNSVTDIFAILTVMLLSLGFIYYIGYFVAALLKQDMVFHGGGPLKEHIFPYGAIFLLAIFISPLMIYLSRSQLSDIRKFIIITFGFVFIFGFINQLIITYLNDTPPALETNIRSNSDR